MLASEPAVAISLVALAALIIAAAAILFVRSRKKKKWKPSKAEKRLLRGFDAQTAHADELAEPLEEELTPQERLKGSVQRYDRATDPVFEDSEWDDWFDGESASGDSSPDRSQTGRHDRDPL